MKLATELVAAGVQWAIDLVTQKQESLRFPGKFHPIPRLRVRLADMALAQSSGLEPVTHELFAIPDNDLSVEVALAAAMRKFMPTHPVYQAFRQSQGMEYVKIDPDWLAEGLGEALHTALRKSVEGPHSCIQHRAIQHLANSDWSALLEETRKEIGKLIDSVKEGRRVALSRYAVGMAIRKAFIDEDQVAQMAGSTDAKGRMIKRDPVADFALMSLTMACKETDPQDFVWGWTSFLCQPLSPEEEAAAQKRFDRLQKKLKTKDAAKTAKEVKEVKAVKRYRVSPLPAQSKRSALA